MRQWLVAVIVLAVFMAPMLDVSSTLAETSPVQQTSPLQVTLSQTSGWTKWQ